MNGFNVHLETPRNVDGLYMPASSSVPSVYPISIIDLPMMALTKEHSDVSIIDIRTGGLDFSILDEMRAQLRPSKGQEKRMPTLLLYDEQGLKLFEDITYLDEYYLTNAEIKVLKTHADEMASRISAGSLMIELGSGYDA